MAETVSSSNANARPDLGETARHLRSVHFLLLLVSALTVMPSISGRRDLAGRARLQLNAVASIQASWDTWAKRFAFDQTAWLESLGVVFLEGDDATRYVSSAEETDPAIRQSEGWTLGPAGAPLTFYLTVQRDDGLSERVPIARPYGELSAADTLPTPLTFPGSGSGAGPFQTLAQFRHFWDASRQPHASIITDISSTLYIFRDGVIASRIETRPGSGKGSKAGLEGRQAGGCTDPSVETAHVGLLGDSYNEIFCGTFYGATFVMPGNVRHARVPKNLQEWLARDFDLDVPLGDFRDSFAALEAVTSDYQELPIEKARRILDAELERSGEPVELLGIRIPEATLAVWGTAILFIVQVYFWLHLRAFLRLASGRDKRGIVNVAWLPLYSDNWARVASLLTACLIPALVPVLLAALGPWPSWVAAAVAIPIAVLGLTVAPLLLTCSRLAS